MSDFDYSHCIQKFKRHLVITTTSLIKDLHRNGKDGENHHFAMMKVCNAFV